MQEKEMDGQAVEKVSSAPDSRVSNEALALLLDSDVIDMHLETYTPNRLFGYDLARRHVKPPLGGRLFGHLDLPRIKDSGLTGAMWSISTNPFRTAEGRWKLLQRNIEKLKALVEEREELALVSTLAAYRAVRQEGRHAVMLSVQGGHALDAGVAERKLPDPDLMRVTLVHLTGSSIGGTSSPLGFSRHLSEHGMAMVEMLDEARVFVDLAHIHPDSFWEAYVVHDRSLPLLVTHTGVRGVKKHWRNLDDAQLRAVAQTGGVVGIIFHAGFLKRRGGPRDARMVVEHIEHAVRVAGEDCVGIGTDYDGFIVPPSDLRDGAGYALVVQELLDNGMPEQRIRKILGGNFLRALGELRP
ncbi:MAG: dipeptidase [Myxococcota bacterium]